MKRIMSQSKEINFIFDEQVVSDIKIFNRWGKKIFESDDIEKHWDGRFQGKLVQQEKYTYLVTVLDVNADIHEFPGIVYLIH